MKDAVLHFLEEYPNLAVLSSFSFAVFVALVGIIPSFFVSAAAVLFFGFWEGVYFACRRDTWCCYCVLPVSARI